MYTLTVLLIGLCVCIYSNGSPVKTGQLFTFTDYSYELFNKVHDFNTVYMLSHNNETINALGAVINKYHVEDYVNLQLLHTHFKLNQDEIIVERMDAKETWTHPYNINTIDVDRIIPYLFQVTGDGLIIPLEFVADSKYHSHTKMINAIDIVFGNQPFLNEFAQVLDDFNVTDIFGIGIVHRNHINHDLNGETTESSNSVDRWYWVRSGSNNSINDSPPTNVPLFTEQNDIAVVDENHPVQGFCGVHSCAHSCGHDQDQNNNPVQGFCGVHSCAHSCGHDQDQNNPVQGFCGVHSCAHSCGHSKEKKQDKIQVQVGWSFKHKREY